MKKAYNNNIEIANTKGNAMTKNQQISAMIRIEFLNNGGDIVKAFDKVIGEGAYAKLAGEVYQALRANHE